jgi:hypothetical protein
VLNVMFAALLGSFSLGLVSDLLSAGCTGPSPAAFTLVGSCRPAPRACILESLHLKEPLVTHMCVCVCVGRSQPSVLQQGGICWSTPVCCHQQEASHRHR